MKISIITCVLNNSKFIKNSLTSFKNQTYKNKEHIVIDGGSTDGTIQINVSREHNVFQMIEKANSFYRSSFLTQPFFVEHCLDPSSPKNIKIVAKAHLRKHTAQRKQPWQL